MDFAEWIRQAGIWDFKTGGARAFRDLAELCAKMHLVIATLPKGLQGDDDVVEALADAKAFQERYG